ncbi:MAG: bifunctional methylenetetrahydrofolate dehydrogenase/methenyltetrahydrofolate cyclohydrolase FolD [Fusobacteriaceae bacterium]
MNNTNILDGKKISQEIKGELKLEIEKLEKITGQKPGLAVVIVGDDKASQIYVNSKIKACDEVGMNSFHIGYPSNISEAELLKALDNLNERKDVHGILVQMPLPKHIDEAKVINKISPKKDADCFTPANIGRMFLNEKNAIKSCTPNGIVELMKRYRIEFSGKRVVILGRSNIVGKPLAIMLINEGATVTVCNSKTPNLKDITREADILVVAIGKDRFIKSDMIKENAVIIDVGINRVEERKIFGDVDFEDVASKASLITPVPGGVGPMTIAMLMKNTTELFKQDLNLS